MHKGEGMFTQKTKGPRLLLVDDEERFRTTLAKRLKEKGFDVENVGSGLEAIDYIKESSVDIVVLDIKMPGLDGIETLSEIKKIECASHKGRGFRYHDFTEFDIFRIKIPDVKPALIDFHLMPVF